MAAYNKPISAKYFWGGGREAASFRIATLHVLYIFCISRMYLLHFCILAVNSQSNTSNTTKTAPRGCFGIVWRMLPRC